MPAVRAQSSEDKFFVAGSTGGVEAARRTVGGSRITDRGHAVLSSEVRAVDGQCAALHSSRRAYSIC